MTVLAQTDPRVGGTVVECDGCGALIVRVEAIGAYAFFDLDGQTGHSCPTRRSIVAFEIVHDANATIEEVARAVQRAVYDEDRDNPIDKIEQVAS